MNGPLFPPPTFFWWLARHASPRWVNWRWRMEWSFETPHLKCWHFGALKKTTGIFFEVVTCSKMCGLLFFHIFSLTQNGGEMSQFDEFWFQTVWTHFKPESRIGFYVHKLHLSLVQTKWPNLNRFSTSNVFLFSWLIFLLVDQINSELLGVK